MDIKQYQEARDALNDLLWKKREERQKLLDATDKVLDEIQILKDRILLLDMGYGKEILKEIKDERCNKES